jgi:hypothetical protein
VGKRALTKIFVLPLMSMSLPSRSVLVKSILCKSFVNDDCINDAPEFISIENEMSNI